MHPNITKSFVQCIEKKLKHSGEAIIDFFVAFGSKYIIIYYDDIVVK